MLGPKSSTTEFFDASGCSYELLRRLGQGGMGEVHLARARHRRGIQKLVVIKRTLRRVGGESADMLLDEARIASSLNHPNVVQVFDVGEVDDDVFFVMEYLDGRDLATIVKRVVSRAERLPCAHAVAIVAAVCAGLHHAHEARGSDGKPMGIVHRDVCPSNIFVTYDGVVKLIDFGIAKARHRATATATGVFKGKLGYASPEQILGRQIDHRSDIYSAATVLYELTTGTRPFRDESDYELAREIVEGSVQPPSRVWPDYPPELERIVLKAMRRDRHERYATSRDMQLELEAFATTHQANVAPGALAALLERSFPRAEELSREDDPTVEVLRGGPPPSARPASSNERPTTQTKSTWSRAVTPFRAVAAVALLSALAGSAILVHARRSPPAAPPEAPTATVMAPDSAAPSGVDEPPTASSPAASEGGPTAEPPRDAPRPKTAPRRAVTRRAAPSGTPISREAILDAPP